MTVQHAQSVRVIRKSAGRSLLAFGFLFLLLLILRNTAIAAEGIRRGILLCSQSVIPSLFPFMVLSEMAVSSRRGSATLNRLSRPLCRLLRLSSMGGSSVLLGLIFGFPMGTKCALRAYDRGEMEKTECERVLALSCLPSSAFLVGTVGTALWNNTRLGVFLYGSILLAVVLCGALAGKKNATASALPMSAPPPQPFCKLLTGAVRSSAQSMLLICAYVLFFSALSETLGNVLNTLQLPHHALTFLSMVLELSGGMNIAAQAPSLFSAILASAGGAWAGLSIHCQLLSFCDGRPLSYRRFLFFKLFHTLLSVGIFATCLWLFPIF